MRVQVYKNLHRGDWSIRANGRVIDHRKSVVLADVVFHVGAAAQARVANGAHRTVHAWAVGKLTTAAPEGAPIPITYRPHVAPYFVRRDNGQRIDGAALVHFTETEGAVAYEVRK